MSPEVLREVHTVPDTVHFDDNGELRISYLSFGVAKLWLLQVEELVSCVTPLRHLLT